MQERCRKTIDERKMPQPGACVLIMRGLLRTGGRCCRALPGLAPPGAGISSCPAPGAAAEAFPLSSTKVRPSPSSSHSTAPGCELSSPCPAPDPAGVPTPSVFTILALLPQCQKPSHSSCLSLMSWLWKIHGCCACFSSQACGFLRLQELCSARVQPQDSPEL